MEKQEFNGKLSADIFIISCSYNFLRAVLLGICQRRNNPVTNWTFHRMTNDRINKNYTKRRKFSIKTMIYRQDSGPPISNIAKIFLQI
jgi:hypothetical protein